MIVQSTRYQVPSRKYGGNRIEIPAAAGSLREKGLKYKFLFPELARIISSLFRRYFQSSLGSCILLLSLLCTLYLVLSTLLTLIK